MVAEYPYKSLKDTLLKLKQQVIDSMPFIGDYVPTYIKNPEQLFYHLKGLTTYKKDPKNVELLQSVQTLMYRGGKGDCDCFTILTLAACEYLGFEPQQVALVGRSQSKPSHIYSLVWDDKKKRMCSMDLTNPYYDMERPYPYKQTLDFMMTLRLEDDGLSGLFKRNPEKKAARKARKTAKKEGRQAVRMARINRKTTKKLRKQEGKAAKAEAKVVRKEMKAKRKVQRATSRTDRAAQRQDNRMIRTTGRGKIIAARQEGRLNKVQERFAPAVVTPEDAQEASYDNQYNPEIDTYQSDVPGGDYMMPDYDEQAEDIEYEIMPDDEGDEDYSTDQMEDLSFGIPSLITGVANVISKAANTKAGQIVQKGTSAYNDIQRLKVENVNLKSELQIERPKKYYYGGGGFVTGVIAGYFIGRK